MNEYVVKDKNGQIYVIHQIQKNYWGEGTTGLQLSKTSHGEQLLPFWIRSEELARYQAVTMNVIAATRADGVVGYFLTESEVPTEFTHPGVEEIAGVMRGFRSADVLYVLKEMNSHWGVVTPKEHYVRGRSD